MGHTDAAAEKTVFSVQVHYIKETAMASATRIIHITCISTGTRTCLWQL